MADVSHLEKMGRELKCPICLSLLNSAVSLTCNHVFCKSCIFQSIKRASNCPVCKVPYHRREVRPAPHMDNLVSIYKSMEIASEVNIFVTPPNRSFDCKREGGNESNFDGPKVRKLNRGKAKKQKSIQQNEEGDMKITNSRISDSQTSGKSSFSANKRVQVLPLREASMLPQTIHGNRGERELNKNAGQECAKDCSNSLNEKSTFEGNGDSLFCPFFWLKETEENQENSDSQSCHVTDDECAAGTSRHIPSFSDIKDSQSPNTMATKECDGTSKAVDFHDSEMFEWTQRACSPELCSTPLKKQMKKMLKNEQQNGLLQEKHGLASVETGSPILSCKQAINSNAGTATTNLNARFKQLKQNVGKPCLKKLTNGVDIFVDGDKYETLTGSRAILEELPTLPRMVAENSSEGTESAENVVCVNLGRKRSERGDIKRSKRIPLPEEVPRKSRVTANNPNEANEIEKIGRSPNLGRKGRKRGGKFIDHPKRKHVKLSINQIDEGPKDGVDEENPKIHQEDDEGPGNENQPLDTLVKRMSRVPNDGIEELDEIPNESREITESPNQGRKHTENIFKRGSKRRVKDRSCSKRNQMEDTARDIGQEVPTSEGQEVGNRSDEKIDPKYKCGSEGHLTSLTAIMAGEVSTELPTNTTDETEMDTLFSKLPLVEANNERTSGQENTVNNKGNKVKSKFQKRKSRTEDQAREATTKVNTIDAAVVEDSPTVTRENTENWFLPSVHDKYKVVFSAKNHQLQKCNEIPRKMPCAFCRSCDVSELTGEMVHYLSGKLIPADYSGGSHVIHSHKKCAEWAPNVYFEEDGVMNLEAEISRSRRIKCSCCGIKGAALGCFDKGCRKSFHVPCAKMTPQCRWDDEYFVMLCPLHSSSSLPKDTPEQQKRSRKQQDAKVKRSAEVNCQWTWPSGSPKKWVLCCSSLNAEEKECVSKLIKLAGISLAKTWNPAVTHVIVSTDENGACKRTLKFLMGILDGKWVLKTDWVKACLTTLQPVNEEKYEIEVDTHGVKGGPREARQRVINKEPKLFHELEFYFVGDFTNSYKGYLHDLVTAGGGVVLHRRPISRIRKELLEESSQCMIYVIYSLEQPHKSDANKTSQIFARRKAEACAIASTVNAKMAPHSWILDSIAASKLQVLDENTA